MANPEVNTFLKMLSENDSLIINDFIYTTQLSIDVNRIDEFSDDEMILEINNEMSLEYAINKSDLKTLTHDQDSWSLNAAGDDISISFYEFKKIKIE